MDDRGWRLHAGGPIFFPWQLCWYFCWYSLNQHLDKAKKSLKKSSFIWRLPGPPMIPNARGLHGITAFRGTMFPQPKASPARNERRGSLSWSLKPFARPAHEPNRKE